MALPFIYPRCAYGVVQTDRERATAGIDPLHHEQLDREHGVASCQLVCVQPGHTDQQRRGGVAPLPEWQSRTKRAVTLPPSATPPQVSGNAAAADQVGLGKKDE